MLEYTVLEVAELMENRGFDPKEILKVNYVFGNDEMVGICLNTADGCVLLKHDKKTDRDYLFIDHGLELEENEYFDPSVFGINEIEKNPRDITDWLNESGKIEDAHMY